MGKYGNDERGGCPSVQFQGKLKEGLKKQFRKHATTAMCLLGMGAGGFVLASPDVPELARVPAGLAIPTGVLVLGTRLQNDLDSFERDLAAKKATEKGVEDNPEEPPQD